MTALTDGTRSTGRGEANPRLRTRLLRRNRNFLHLWLANSISTLGSHATQLAVPVLALTYLNITPTQIGLLMSTQSFTALGAGLAVGALIDRLPRRVVLVVSNVGLALALAAIPVCSVLDALSIPVLFIIVGVIGALASFEVALQALLPTLVRQGELATANGLLQAGSSGASMLGPGFGGALIRSFGPTAAFLADSASYVASAFLIARIRVSEQPRLSGIGRRSMVTEVKAGLKAVFRDAIQRTITSIWSLQAFLGSMIGPLYFLYVIRTLELDALVLGIVGMAGASAALVGSLLAPRIMRSVGLWPTLSAATGALAVSPLFILAVRPDSSARLAVPLISCGAAVGAAGVGVASVVLSSLRQAVTPQAILGRVAASNRVAVGIAALAGTAAGGILAGTLGVYPAVVAAAFVRPLIWVRARFSPLRRLHEIPAMERVATATTPNDPHASRPDLGSPKAPQ